MGLERRGGLVRWDGDGQPDTGKNQRDLTSGSMFCPGREEPYETRVSRTVVCPGKVGMFSRRQTCRGNSQEPRSWDSRVAGNQDSEAYRQGLLRGDHEPPGRNNSERECGLESE